jgi:hypothetical protein
MFEALRSESWVISFGGGGDLCEEKNGSLEGILTCCSPSVTNDSYVNVSSDKFCLMVTIVLNDV